MNKIVYVCTGTCKAEISDEQYEAGLIRCGTPECTLYNHTFEKRIKCGVCSQLYKQEEDHSHRTK